MTIFVGALIVDALAPSFGGTKNQVAALKVVAYASTAGLVAGVLSILPSLSILGFLASLYSAYLVFLGLPVLMKCPQDKAGAYTAVSIVCMVLVGVVLFGVMAAVTPSTYGRFGAAGFGGRDGGSLHIRNGDTDVTIDTAAMKEAAARMEEAGKRMQAAQAASDPAAAGKALGDMVGAMSGAGGNAAPIAPADLKALLPEALGGLPRQSYEANGGQAMGIASSNATATYAAADKSVNLTITDLGGMGGLAGLAGWANMTVDRETQDEVEKVYKDGGRTVREQYRKDGSSGTYSIILANGVIVEARGDHVDMAAIKSAAAGIDLGKLEALKRSAKPA